MAEELKTVRLVIVGEVDHGKSTLVGRLLYDTNSLAEGKLEALEAISKKRGRAIEWAFALDAFQAERDQGITIDTTTVWFNTKRRQFVLVDAPGHHEFVRNMITGAAESDAALLLIDAGEGIKPQTRRHAMLLYLLGVRQLVVLVNKLDLIDFSEREFARLSGEAQALLAEVGLKANAVIPAAARDGDNIANRSERMAWYAGPTLLESLDGFDPAPTSEALPFRFPVQDTYRVGEKRIYAGRIESGKVAVGDMVLVSPVNRQTRVRSIEVFGAAAPVQHAHAGQSVGLTLDDQVFADRGALFSHVEQAPIETNEIKARIFWLPKSPLVVGQALRMRIGTSEVPAQITEIVTRIRPAGLESGAKSIEQNDLADVRLRLGEVIAIDNYLDLPATGRFALVDISGVVGGGVADLHGVPDQRRLRTQAGTNLTAVAHSVPKDVRNLRNGHRGLVIWLTGLSGAGKSTLGMALERRLFERGYQTYVLDGDNVRRGLNSDLTFSADDRTENIRRVAEVAALFADGGTIAITAFISPFRAGREHARKAAGETNFAEIYVKASLAACEARDPKGLYVKARKGEIRDFTGISADYEEPENADLVVDTEAHDFEQCLEQLFEYVVRQTKV
ncbi:MAG: cysC [Alphaproteobacteria bacterium]|nr:cysC [Alphaproteobacteria bacterium]